MRCDILNLEIEILKGWIKLKSKKMIGLLLVVTLLSATVFGTASVFAAGAQTNVRLESYMPPVKTVFVDDDFENRTVGSEIKTASNYDAGTQAISGWDSTNKKNVYASVSGNDTEKYAKIEYKYSNIRAKSDKDEAIKNAEKLVITFDNKFVAPTTETTYNNYTSQIEIRCVDPSKTSSTLPIVRFEGARKSGTEKNDYFTVKYYKTGSTTATTLAGNLGTYNTEWNKIYLVLSKEFDTETKEYYAYIDKVMVDGITGTPWNVSGSFDIPEKVPANALRSDWWSNGTVAPITISAASTITETNEMYFDNILIYEPYDVYMTDVNTTDKTVKIVNNGSTNVSGKVFLALYDNDKNLISATETTNELTVAAGENHTVTLEGEIPTTGAAKAKIFFWNKSSLAPLCAPAEV